LQRISNFLWNRMPTMFTKTRKQTYAAHEFHNGEPTDVVWIYLADSLEEAVKAVSYTLRLKTANVRIGPTGHVVYSDSRAYAVVPTQEIPERGCIHEV